MRRGRAAYHVRLHWIANRHNPRLPPGVRAEDVRIPPTSIPSDEHHDYSSDLGEGENRRGIIDLQEYIRQPDVLNTLQGPHPEPLRNALLTLSRYITQRNLQRQFDRLYSMNPTPEERTYTQISEPEADKEQCMYYDKLMEERYPPPPPVPLNPINCDY